MKASIVAAARTPIGAFNGALSSLSAVPTRTQLLSGMFVPNKPLLKDNIDEVILGQCWQQGCVRIRPSKTAIHAGLPKQVIRLWTLK